MCGMKTREGKPSLLSYFNDFQVAGLEKLKNLTLERFERRVSDAVHYLE